MAYQNLYLDTIIYESEYPDGHNVTLSANTITERMCDHIDDEQN